jgi:RNA polymerase sigma factor (sigma-70 family)
VSVELTGQIEAAEPAASPSDLDGMEDEMLVAAAKKGEGAAFAMLVERHKPRMFFSALRITRNREDAEDAVQQSLHKAFVHLHSFAGRSSFSTWLTRVAINEALMLLRKNRGWREVLSEDLNGSADSATGLEVPAATLDPEASYSRREWVGMLSSAMNELKPGMRKAIQLRELDERSMEETARIMGISVGAAKARVFHGRRKLRERLQLGSSWAARRDTSRTIGA